MTHSRDRVQAIASPTEEAISTSPSCLRLADEGGKSGREEQAPAVSKGSWSRRKLHENRQEEHPAAGDAKG